MTKVTGVFILFLTGFLFVPKVYAQDLSKYRTVSLGTSLQQVSKLIGQLPTDANVIQQSPATIQELVWHPSEQSGAVQKVVLSFYNGTLYKITATYDSTSTEGLTSDDMVRAISTTYGVATLAVVDTSSQTSLAYSALDTIVARWEDSQHCLVLSRGSFLKAFQLVIYTKQMNDQAEASIVVAARLEKANAPQVKLARVQKAADELETARQNNIKAFRP